MPTTKARYDGKTKTEMFQILRREILTARLEVTLDNQLGRPTSDVVRRLATVELPPIIRENAVPAGDQGIHRCCCRCAEMHRGDEDVDQV